MSSFPQQTLAACGVRYDTDSIYFSPSRSGLLTQRRSKSQIPKLKLVQAFATLTELLESTRSPVRFVLSRRKSREERSRDYESTLSRGAQVFALLRES